MGETISVIVSDVSEGKGPFGSVAPVQVDIPVEKLRKGLNDLIEKLRGATEGILGNTGGLTFKELEIGVEVSAEGGFSLIGTAKATGTASLKLTFTHT